MMQTVMNHLNTNFTRAFDANASASDVLADELGKQQSIDERWDTWRTEKCAFVERVILNFLSCLSGSELKVKFSGQVFCFLSCLSGSERFNYNPVLEGSFLSCLSGSEQN